MGIAQTLGIGEKSITGTLVFELWLLFFAGYPIGCLLGNCILKVFYGHELSKTDQIFAQDGIGAAGFHVSWDAMMAGFIFLLSTLAIVGFCIVHIASAILSGCDVIVSWSFKHIVNIKTMRGITCWP